MASAWSLLSQKGDSELSRVLEQICEMQDQVGGVCGMCDSGFRGRVLCGSKRLLQLERAGQVRGECKASGNGYRFGGGQAQAFRTVQLGEARTQCDVIKGSLPLLFGNDALSPPSSASSSKSGSSSSGSRGSSGSADSSRDAATREKHAPICVSIYSLGLRPLGMST